MRFHRFLLIIYLSFDYSDFILLINHILFKFESYNARKNIFIQNSEFGKIYLLSILDL